VKDGLEGLFGLFFGFKIAINPLKKINRFIFGNVESVSIFAVPKRTRILRADESGKQNRRRAIRGPTKMKILI